MGPQKSSRSFSRQGEEQAAKRFLLSCLCSCENGEHVFVKQADRFIVFTQAKYGTEEINQNQGKYAASSTELNSCCTTRMMG
jgi:hypothetical protein